MRVLWTLPLIAHLALSGCGSLGGTVAEAATEGASLRAADPNLVAEAVELTDEARWLRTVRDLAGRTPITLSTGPTLTLESRHSSTQDNTHAGQYIYDRLEALGWDVRFQTFSAPTGTERNIVATKRGTTRPGEIVVMGAHYDSTAQSSSNAPGADDNASGVATLLEVATTLSGYRLERTVELVAFGSEEQGLYGSSAYVQEAKDERADIKVAVICDMVGWYDRDFSVLVEGGLRYAGWMQTAVEAAATYSTVDTRRSWYSFGSDHVPFQSARIPAFLIIEEEWYRAPHYHSSTDTADVVDEEFGGEIARMVVATVAEIGGISGRANKLMEAPTAKASGQLMSQAPIIIRADEPWAPLSHEDTCRLHSEEEEVASRGGL